MKTLTNKWYEEVRQGPSGSEDDEDEAELLWALCLMDVVCPGLRLRVRLRGWAFFCQSVHCLSLPVIRLYCKPMLIMDSSTGLFSCVFLIWTFQPEAISAVKLWRSVLKHLTSSCLCVSLLFGTSWVESTLDFFLMFVRGRIKHNAAAGSIRTVVPE